MAGFLTAICIHAVLKGNGNIMEGIKNIFEQDVLRRTNGADLNNFDVAYWPSMNASTWEVFLCIFPFLNRNHTGCYRKSVFFDLHNPTLYFCL